MKPPKWFWLIPLLLLVTWIGARGAAADPLWEDEWQSIYNAGGEWYGPRSPADIWTHIAANDPWHPPGYFILYAGWGHLVGWSAFAGRALSVLLGVLTIAIIYRAGRDFRSHAGGWGAAAALATCGFFGVYLHEMRPYILYAFWVPLTVWLYWRLINTRQPSRWIQAMFALCAAGLVYTHYFATLVGVAIGGYHVLFVMWRANHSHPPYHRWRPIMLLILGGVLFVPWLGTVFMLLGSGEQRPFTFDTAGLAQYTLFLFSNGSIALMGFIALVGIVRKRAVGYVWFIGLSVLAMILLVNAWRPIVNQMRYVMGMFPLLALIVGMGVDRLARHGVKLIYVTVVWLLAGLFFLYDGRTLADIDKPYNYMPWDALAREIAPYAQANDTAVMLLPYPAYELVQRHLADYYLHGVPGRYEILESPAFSGVELYNQRARALLAEAQRLWVAYDPQQPPDQIPFDTLMLSTHAFCTTVSDTPEIHLSLYAPLPTGEKLSRFGEGVAASSLLPLAVHNAVLNVTLGWQVDEVVPLDTFSVALHVTDASGTLVAQDDYALPHEALRCHTSFIPIEGLAVGEYSLWAIVYDWQTGERLSVNDTDRVLLGTFTR